MFSLQTLGAKAILLLVIILAVAGITFTATRSHYIIDLDTLKAQISQAAADQQKIVDETNTHNNFIQKEAYDQVQAQLATATATINSMRDNPTIVTRTVPSTSGCSIQSSEHTTGPGANQSSGQSAAPAGPTTEEVSTLPTDDLRTDLQVGIDALNAELIWRDWMRGVK